MRLRLFACLAVSLITLTSAITRADDWPQWRGPKRDGICTETGLLKEWPKGGPKLLWDSRKVNTGICVGAGFSSLAITQDKIFTMGDRKPDKKSGSTDDGCFVICLDANTGKEIWKSKVGPTTNAGGYPGPRCIPTVHDDRLYVIHPNGILACLKSKDGAQVWQKDFGTEYGVKPQGWGYCESPTIDGDKLLCTPCGKDAVMVALDKMTGAPIWQTKLPEKSSIGSGCGYSSIVTTEAGGVKQYLNVTGSNLGLIGVDAKTGKFLWNYSKAVRGTANVPTAVVSGDFVFTSTAYNAGAALLKIAADGKGNVKAVEQYYIPGNKLQNHHGGVIMIGDYIYGGHGGNNSGSPFCLEWKTGKFAWGPDRDDRGAISPLYAEGHLYVRHQNGDVELVEANPKAYTVKSSFKANLGSNNWPHPVIWHGKLYLRGQDVIQCYDIKQ